MSKRQQAGQPIPQQKKKKSPVKIALIVLAVLVVIGVIGGLGGNSDGGGKTEPTAPTPEAKEPVNAPEDTPASLQDRLNEEVGTSARVDEIAKIAKGDAGSIGDQEKSEAIDYIAANLEGCFGDNEAMEQVMYYGCLLEYGFPDERDVCNLGMDANQAVKYVYRGAESVDDDATQANISQVKESLSALGK